MYRRDPLGGAYFFNSTQVAHYDSTTGFTTLLTERDFGGGPYAIDDVTGGSDGALYVATDNGIYVWENGQIAATWVFLKDSEPAHTASGQSLPMQVTGSGFPRWIMSAIILWTCQQRPSSPLRP